MTLSHQIQLAADLLENELSKRGIFSVSKAECLRIARALYSAWTFTVDHTHLKPGEIAQKHRERYEARCSFIDGPLAPLTDAERAEILK
jgi:hypothetical protein